MEESKATLLIVEDDLDIADMLQAYFRNQGYEVVTVNWGEDGLEKCQNEQPDLVILDIRLPDIDGFEVAKRLRTNRKTREIPIIFLTEKRERMDRLKGLELSAEDYITKPFDVQELRLRVRNALQRSRRITLTNPVTALPEGDLVDEYLKKYLDRTDFRLVVVSIKNLERFREVYGFIASDDLLRAVAMMLKGVVQDFGSGDDFIGHLSACDFMILSRSASLPEMKERTRKMLEQSFEYFYRHQDRESDTFRTHGLSVSVIELPRLHGVAQSLQSLKAELEQIYR